MNVFLSDFEVFTFCILLIAVLVLKLLNNIHNLKRIPDLRTASRTTKLFILILPVFFCGAILDRYSSVLFFILFLIIIAIVYYLCLYEILPRFRLDKNSEFALGLEKWGLVILNKRLEVITILIIFAVFSKILIFNILLNPYCSTTLSNIIALTICAICYIFWITVFSQDYMHFLRHDNDYIEQLQKFTDAMNELETQKKGIIDEKKTGRDPDYHLAAKTVVASYDIASKPEFIAFRIAFVAHLFAVLYIGAITSFTIVFLEKDPDNAYHNFWQHSKCYELLADEKQILQYGVLPIRIAQEYSIVNPSSLAFDCLEPDERWLFKNEQIILKCQIDKSDMQRNNGKTIVCKSAHFFDHFYLNVVTISTLGFGDITPISRLARINTLFQCVASWLVLLFGMAQLITYHVSHMQMMRDAVYYHLKEITKPKQEPAGKEKTVTEIVTEVQSPTESIHSQLETMKLSLDRITKELEKEKKPEEQKSTDPKKDPEK